MRAVFDPWPMFGLQDDVRPALAGALAADGRCVLATLAAADGGAPFGVGAQMLFAADAVSGFLTGGCVEADVALHAAETLADGEPRRVVYGEGGAEDIRLPCGGRINVLVERIDPDDVAAHRLIALGDARRPALWLSDGRRRTCLGVDEPPPAHLGDALAAVVGCAALLGDTVLRRFDPVHRLVVLGHDPIALAIAAQGLGLGWATTLIRPRGPAEPPPLPGLSYRREAVAEALAALAPDPWTAVVVATHERGDPGEEATAAACSTAGYVGLLGSRRRLPQRLALIRAGGAAGPALERLHAPVGLDIGARGPREIAVSVAAEIVGWLRAAEGRRLWPAAAAAQAA